MKKYKSEIFEPYYGNPMGYKFRWVVRPLMVQRCFRRQKVMYEICTEKYFKVWERINENTYLLSHSFDEALRMVKKIEKDKRREYRQP